MRYRRDRTEIIALILESANMNKITRTRIMYGAVLSPAQLKEYLSLLLESGLLNYHKEEGVYEITEKGKHFLQIYNQFSKMSLLQ
jgi:predicted transcriptional regulator